MSEDKKDLFEWTKTLEMEYQETQPSFDLQEYLEKTDQFKDTTEEFKKDENDSFLIDDYVLSLGQNPFYQPSMHTSEFSQNQMANVDLKQLSINNANSLEEQLQLLDYLYQQEMISSQEYEVRKNELLK